MSRHLTRRHFLGLSAAGLGGLWLPGAREAFSASPSSPLEKLYGSFRDPGREYSMRPYWFWNGKLDAAEIRRQIQQMVDHGVYGVYVHNRDGLATPYLSEEWWQAVGSALKTSRELGFSLCMVDDFEWPTGDARDYWLPGPNKSRVLAADPQYHMKHLRPVESRANGPARVEISLSQDTALVVAGKRTETGAIDGSTLRTVKFNPGIKSLVWDAPPGEWLITTYSLELTHTSNDSFVDLMNQDAIGKFIEIYYEEFFGRYGAYFGSTLPATFSDHEGYYGVACAWTPRLFDTFRSLKGYDLEPMLPGLAHDIGKKTEKLRCDYLDVVSDLYCNSFFKQINDWCAAHKIEYAAHEWEESLFFGPQQGDYYRIFRSMSHPACDSLFEWGRQSTWLKEVASIADFEGRHLRCENQGAQGGDSYLSLEKLRYVSNSLGAWNVGEFISHAFDYDLARTNWPPDWFRSQPFLPWFKHYADTIRRISFMNRQSFEVADLLLYYPQVSIFGQASPVLGAKNILDREESSWSEDAVLTNSQYALLKLRLSEERIDYKIADDSYLAESRMEGRLLAISTSRFKTLVLPPMSTMRRSSAERVAEFYRAGGTVIVMGELPSISVEDGRGDPRLQELWASVFDDKPALRAFTLRTNAAGGRAYCLRPSSEDVVELLREIVDPDLEIVDGPTGHLHVLHKVKDGLDFYWVVNDSPSPRTNLLRFRATGRPERWDATSGRRMPVFYQTEKSRTLVRVAFGPWDASYIVFDPAGESQPLTLRGTNLDEFAIVRATVQEVVVRGRSLADKQPAFIELSGNGKTWRGSLPKASIPPLEIEGDWKVTAESPTTRLPYADVKDDPADRGRRENWFAGEPRREWSRLWLDPRNCSIRQWNVIGPFPNPDDTLDHSFAPEREIDYHAVYAGDAGCELRWVSLDNDCMEVNSFVIDDHEVRYDPSINVIQYGKALHLDMHPQGTIYLQTNIYCPVARDAEILLAIASPITVWLNNAQAYSRWLRPLYYDVSKDGFAHRIPVRLDGGWNSLLIKVIHKEDDIARHGGPILTCRAQAADGGAQAVDGGMIGGLRISTRQTAPDRIEPQSGYRWLRFPVPPLAGGLRVQPLQKEWLAFVDGKAVPSTTEIPLPTGSREVVLRVSAGEWLPGPFAFVTRSASMPLGSWNVSGLEHFSGLMTYEKSIEVPASLLAERVLLDCGQVGVCAEAWVNSTYVGAQPWQPYVFDVTEQLCSGRNDLKVRIANSDANARAVGPSLPILKKIDLNGWHGPARLVPYLEREIHCVQS